MEGAGAGSRITRKESKDSHVDDLTIIATRVRNLIGRAGMVLVAAADDELLLAGADLLAELGEDGAVDGGEEGVRVLGALALERLPGEEPALARLALLAL